MPLYEYECQSCGNRFEKIRKFSDPPLEACPACGGPVQKLVSSPAFQFKGSGFYITDYGRKGEGGGANTSDKSDKSDRADKSDKAEKADKAASESAKPAASTDPAKPAPASPAPKTDKFGS